MSPALVSLPPPVAATRRRQRVEDELINGKDWRFVVADVSIELGVPASIIRRDIRATWKRWRLRANEQADRRRWRILERLEWMAGKANATGELELELKILSKLASLLGMDSLDVRVKSEHILTFRQLVQLPQQVANATLVDRSVGIAPPLLGSDALRAAVEGELMPTPAAVAEPAKPTTA